MKIKITRTRDNEYIATEMDGGTACATAPTRDDALTACLRAIWRREDPSARTFSDAMADRQFLYHWARNRLVAVPEIDARPPPPPPADFVSPSPTPAALDAARAWSTPSEKAATAKPKSSTPAPKPVIAKPALSPIEHSKRFPSTGYSDATKAPKEWLDRLRQYETFPCECGASAGEKCRGLLASSSTVHYARKHAHEAANKTETAPAGAQRRSRG